MNSNHPNLQLTFVDLFAGCGGLSWGLEEAGFTPLFVNELNKDALGSYLLNRTSIYPYLADSSFNCNDVKELVNSSRINKLKTDLRKTNHINIENGELDLLVGGPPCQGFSGIGHRRSYSVDKEQLPSNHLFQDMAWVIHALNPKIFLFENVKGLLTAKWNQDGINGEIWNDVKETFARIPNYTTSHALVHAKNYGVAQNRPRVLLVGIRNDIFKPSISSLSTVAQGFLPDPTYNAPDLIDLLGDLIDPNYTNGGKTDFYPSPAKNELQKSFRTTLEGKALPKGAKLTEHVYSKHSDIVLNKFKIMIERNGVIPENLKTKKFAQRLLPSKWGESGPSITATSLPDDYVHFAQPRILTVREWARLQGFPDWYSFAGSRTTGGIRRAGNPRAGIFDRELPKYTQIGNAVPVPLARAVGLHFRRILCL